PSGQQPFAASAPPPPVPPPNAYPPPAAYGYYGPAPPPQAMQQPPPRHHIAATDSYPSTEGGQSYDEYESEVAAPAHEGTHLQAGQGAPKDRSRP
ncbi:hypothetical protein KEM55_007708, partial [Ascosphaera atra]